MGEGLEGFYWFIFHVHTELSSPTGSKWGGHIPGASSPPSAPGCEMKPPTHRFGQRGLLPWGWGAPLFPRRAWHDPGQRSLSPRPPLPLTAPAACAARVPPPVAPAHQGYAALPCASAEQQTVLFVLPALCPAAGRGSGGKAPRPAATLVQGLALCCCSFHGSVLNSRCIFMVSYNKLQCQRPGGRRDHRGRGPGALYGQGLPQHREARSLGCECNAYASLPAAARCSVAQACLVRAAQALPVEHEHIPGAGPCAVGCTRVPRLWGAA